MYPEAAAGVTLLGYSMNKSDESSDSNGPENLGRHLSLHYRAPLISFFLRRVSNRAEAEDLTQEVFMRVLKKSGADDIHNVEAFLFSTATNLLRDRARRQKIRTDYERRILADPDRQAEELSPERNAIATDSLQNVLTVMTELDDRTRDIFVLRRLENLKVREIADMCGISISTVEKHIVKAVSYLARRLQELR